MEFQRAFQRIKKDRWALVCFFYILLLLGISIFAYQLAPDKTRYANQMHLSIHSQPPGFETKMLLVPQKNGSRKQYFFSGNLNPDEEIPIEEIRWLENGLEFKRVGNATDYFETLRLDQFPEGTTQSSIEKNYIKIKKFYLGTDKYGRDLLSRLLIGSRISISIGFVAVIISLIIGILLGALAGYFGGWIDATIMWLINVSWSIPTLLMVIAINLALGKGFWQVFVAVGLTMWVEVARLVRGQVKVTKEQDFIQAAKVLGFSSIRILVKTRITFAYSTFNCNFSGKFCKCDFNGKWIKFFRNRSSAPDA